MQSMKRWAFLFALVLVLPCAGLSSGSEISSQAELQEKTESSDTTAISEILVIGEFRKVELGKLPVSLSVFDRQLIDQRNAHHLEELLGMAANVNSTNGASRSRYFQIRGIGERGQFSEPLNASVGLLIDDVDFSGIGTISSLFDVDQVEIFRGPQGTRYGANALAGLINVHTQDPVPNHEGSLRLEAADYSTYSLGGVASGPITEKLLYRLAVQQYRSDGFVHNDFLDKDDTNDRNESTLRSKLRWFVSDYLTLDFTLGYVDIDNGYDAFSLDNKRDTLSDQPGHDRQESHYLNFHISVEPFQAFSVEAILSYATSDIEYGYDEDWTFVGFDPDGYTSTDDYLRNRDTYTAEVRMVSRDDQRIFSESTAWVLGIYALNQDVSLKREYTFLASDFASEFKINRLALYGQTETFVTENTVLTLGLRLEQHDAEYSDSNAVEFDPSDSLYGGRISLDHVLTPQTMIYASISRGYKAGGFNTDGSLDPDLRLFDPEVLWNYEIGVKGSWLNGRLEGRVSLFEMQRDEVQISSSLVRVRADGSAEFVAFVGNAAEGFNRGLEAEFDWQVTARTSLTASLGLLHAEYENFINAAGDNLGGRDQAQAPRYQFAAGINHAFSNAVSAGLQVEGKGSYFFSDSHSEKSPAYALLSAHLGWQRGSWAVNIWGRNLTDKDYFVRGFFFGNDPRDGYAAGGYTQLGEPRRLGITLNLNF